MDRIPRRVSLTPLPTPVHTLPRLTELLGGPQLFIKRDDLTGLAGGGNKTRKLEFLVAEAQAQNADRLVTVGAAQSNHCRQTAAAAAKVGLRCTLVLRGNAPPQPLGNLLLDHLLGADILWSGEREREEVMEEFVDGERRAGRRPYPIPLGGSNALGAAAYALAMEEFMGQGGDSCDRIVFASSSGGTHGGMAAGAAATGYRGEVLGISIDEELDSLKGMVAGIAAATSHLLGMDFACRPADVHANADYLGQGYGIVGAPEREAIGLFARYEGILLDPVYTGRAAAGLIDLIRRGAIDKGEKVLFWHTGGAPALWAYMEELT